MPKKSAVVAAAVAFAALLSLTACAPGDPAADCTPTWSRGGIADSVSATGAVDELPLTVDFPTPLVATEAATTSVLTAGDGETVLPGRVVLGALTVAEGETGQVVTYGQTVFTLGDPSAPLFDAALCATVGSRVAAAGPASSLVGDDFVAQWGIEPDLTLVSVLDIDGVYLSRADGAPQPPQSGLPTVTLDADGRPGLSFTGAEAPADLRVAVLQAGDGEEVAGGDAVLVNYTGVDWDTQKVFDSSWEKGAPTVLSTSGVVQGFAEAIVGQKVGSQILATIPPELGYADSASSPVGPDGTMVFVIDILGIVSAE